jgi:hypothetical protein
MKINWRIAIAVTVMVAAVIWMFDSVRTRYYEGNDLSFNVGSGIVTLTNASDESIDAQLTGTGARTFTVSGAEAGNISGTSTKQGTGRASTQLFDFTILPGTSAFSVVRGTDIRLTSNNTTPISASVEPLTGSEVQTITLVGSAVLLGAALYIMNTIRSDRMNAQRRKEYDERTANRVIAASEANRGRDGRAYSDS